MKNPAAKHLYPMFQYFDYESLLIYPHPPSQATAKLISDLADILLDELPDGPEKAEGFRKLLEAKDCFIRAGIRMK